MSKHPQSSAANSPAASGSPVLKPWEHAKAGQGGSGGDELAARFVESLSYDRRLYPYDIAGSLAHAAMLRKVGLISAKDLAAIRRGLQQIKSEIEAAGADYGAAWPGWKIELEDVHMCIEAALIEKIGEPGRKLHTGRSRNDQVALDLTLWIQDALDGVRDQLEQLRDAFYELSQRDGQVVMPAYTHLQRAQPIVAGGELVAWAEAFDHAAQRLKSLRSGPVGNPLGSGAIAGSSLPLDRAYANEQVAKVTGISLSFATASSIEATASRDLACDFLHGLGMAAMWLSRWAEQWILYASTEFGFITLDGRYTTGSSMMPQKRNPDMLELIRGRCGGVYGHLLAMLTLLKGLPMGYNRDLQEDKRHVFAAYDMVVDSLEMARRIVTTTRFKQEQIQVGLDKGFLDATSLAEYLVTRGIPFRTAHQIVGALVRECENRGFNSLERLELTDMNQACAQVTNRGDVCAEDVYQWLGPGNVVRGYQSYGNAGVKGFEEQLVLWRERKRQNKAKPGT